MENELMTDLTYCTICTNNFGDEGFDYSKDVPVCLGCADDREHRQDSAFYTFEPGHEVVFQDEENPFFVVRNGDMRIHATKNGHEVVIRYTDQLEEFGITNDKQLGEWSAKGEEVFSWVNNSWFEVWNDEDEAFDGGVYHELDEAISAAISLKETFSGESDV
jgi:hypothetical protein